MRIPTVETRRLRLRPFERADEESWHDTIFADAEVMRFLPGGVPRERERTAGAVGRVLDSWERRGIGFWACETLDGTFVGHAGLNAIEDGEIEVLYGFGRAYWGRGFATEAAAASLRYGFVDRGLEKIVALAVPENAASRRVMEKLGMTIEREGEHLDMHVVVYAISRSEYAPPEDERYRLLV